MDYIGKVKLNLDFYRGNDLYSDGDRIEEELLEICKCGDIKSALYNSNKWPILYHLSDIRGNIIDWYPFKENASILEVGSGCGAISGFLCKKASRVVGIELSKRRSLINAYRNQDCSNLEIMVGNFKDVELDEKFDYVTLIGVLEYASGYIGGEQPHVALLKKIQQYLKSDGKIIIAIENKMGLKYWNGANEDHLGKRFKGIEDYRYVSHVRTFSKPELIQIMKESEIDQYKFYYPVPDYKLPFAIYSDEYLPHIGDIRTWGKNYDSVRIGVFNEGIVSDQVCKDKMFDYFSNSFLIICNEVQNTVDFACYSNEERADDFQTRTLIVNSAGNEKVVKKSFINKGKKCDIFHKMENYYEILGEEFPNLEILKPYVEDETLTYKFIDGTPLDVMLASKVHCIDDLMNEFKKIIDTYMTGKADMMMDFTVTDKYTQLFGNNVVETKEKCLPVTNLDMLLSNMILKDGRVYCIDYEWLVDFPVPYEFVIYRCVSNFWVKFGMYFAAKISRSDFLCALGIKEENLSIYGKMGKMFIDKVFGTGKKSGYLKNYKKQSGVIEWRSC